MTYEIIKMSNWILKLPFKLKNCGKIAPKKAHALGLKNATIKPSLYNERLLFEDKFSSKEKFLEDFIKSKAKYNK